MTEALAHCAICDTWLTPDQSCLHIGAVAHSAGNAIELGPVTQAVNKSDSVIPSENEQSEAHHTIGHAYTAAFASRLAGECDRHEYRRRERCFRERRVSIQERRHIEPSPDGVRFMQGCLIALPLSAALWWLILEVARAMI